MPTLLLAVLTAALVAVAVAIVVGGARRRRAGLAAASVRRRTNDALRLAAVALDAEATEGPGTEHGARTVEVRGRRHGSAYHLVVVEAPRHREPARRWMLRLEVRHYGAVATVDLVGPGVEPPAVEPAALRTRIDEACRAMVGTGA